MGVDEFRTPLPPDEEFARLRDTLPRLWWALYQGARQEGFDETQSMALVRTWILSINQRARRVSDRRQQKDQAKMTDQNEQAPALVRSELTDSLKQSMVHIALARGWTIEFSSMLQVNMLYPPKGSPLEDAQCEYCRIDWDQEPLLIPMILEEQLFGCQITKDRVKIGIDPADARPPKGGETLITVSELLDDGTSWRTVAILTESAAVDVHRGLSELFGR